MLAEIAEADEHDVDLAVKAARRAHRGWSRMPGSERAKYLYRIARIIAERSRELAVLESIDNGKPIKESRDVDVPIVSAHFFYYAGLGRQAEVRRVRRDLARRGRPGHPVELPAADAGLEDRARAGLRQHRGAQAGRDHAADRAAVRGDLPAGRPAAGVVNIVTGAGGTGQALVGHPDVDKVAFTGSTDVGKAIARTVAGTDKRVTLELGGKAANIVFDDAPLDQAVEGIVNGIFFNQGHVCCAGSRLLVQESVAEDVLHRLKRRMATLRVGDPLDKNTDIGAINSAEQLARIRELSDVGEAEGAERWSAPCELPSHGYWFPPTLFTDVTQAHRIAREEIFGPVLSVLTFRTPAEAVAKANNTPYGLSAGVWTDKGSRILQIANQLRAGVVWANTFNKFDPASPFGGYKESGYGREGGTPRAGGLPAMTPQQQGRRSQDLQALHRRGVPPLGVGALLRRRGRQGEVPGQRREGLAQGRPRRRRGRSVRRSAAGPAARRTTAPRWSTGSPR